MSYVDHLLSFPDEAAAIAALPSLRAKGAWKAEVAIVQAKTADAVLGPVDVNGFATIAQPAQYLPGFWLQVANRGESAELKQAPAFDHAYDRATGKALVVQGKRDIAGINQIIGIDGGFCIINSPAEKPRANGQLVATEATPVEPGPGDLPLPDPKPGK